ncbi:MAG: ABC transporter ATP-binding protein, partial [Planctomycetota bacterium]|jgi:phospholipid/cholesterol/gamma-HCH transport system ATP-binding protein
VEKRRIQRSKKNIEKSKASTLDGDGVIVLKNLTKAFGDHLVLNNVSLTIEKGKTTVIIGPSGCGKTVLIKHLIVLLRPSSGEIFFKDQRIDDLNENELNKVRTRYGFLFQGGALFDSLSVAENITFPLRQHFKIKNWSKVDELVKTNLSMVGLDGFQNYYPANLSGGQRKRVALARAIALNPEVILYDEPTTGLDPIRSDVINELIMKLKRELGVTSVVVTHDMTSAYKIADRIIMLHHGKIVADGNAKHIRNHPHPVVQQFIKGKVNEDDLAVLRASGTIFKTQFLPHDFEE